MLLCPWSRKNLRPFRTVKSGLQWSLWRHSKLLGCLCRVVPPETNIWTKKIKLNLLLLIIKESYAPLSQFLQAEHTVDLISSFRARRSSQAGRFSGALEIDIPCRSWLLLNADRGVCTGLFVTGQLWEGKAVLARLFLMDGYLQTAACSQGFKLEPVLVSKRQKNMRIVPVNKVILFLWNFQTAFFQTTWWTVETTRGQWNLENPCFSGEHLERRGWTSFIFNLLPRPSM